jgi:small conductance mechanosensitive channel
MNDKFGMIEHAQQVAVDLALQFGPKVLVALLLFAAGLVAAQWAGRLVDGGLRKLNLEPPARQLLARTARIIVVCLFSIMALQNLGVQLLPLIAGLGVAGAGIALAMQGVLGNLVAGLSVIFTKPFCVGEYISIAGEEGRVEDITLFTTVLSHPDLSRVVIPNRKVVGEILHNYGKVRQLCVTVSIGQDADLAAALAALGDVLQRNPRALKDPAPVVAVSLRAPALIDIAVKPWVGVTDFGAAGSEIARAIAETFRERKIAVPVPQREVRMLG